MGKVPVTQSVIELIEPVLMVNGLELVDVEFKRRAKAGSSGFISIKKVV